MTQRCKTCGQELIASKLVSELEKTVFKLKLVCKKLSNADNLKTRDAIVEEEQTLFRTVEAIQQVAEKKIENEKKVTKEVDVSVSINSKAGNNK